MEKMYVVLTMLSLCWGFSNASDEWCYTGCGHTPSKWAHLSGSFCGRSHQSPINIVTSHVKTDANLGNFTFVNFSSREAFHNIVNNGHTIKVNLKDNMVEVHGGGLGAAYVAVQFHFHWGDTEHHPGSEHLVDNKRFHMEMHVVTLKKGLTVEQAKADPQGIAVLGFLIEGTTNISKSEQWTNLTAHLMNSTEPVSLTDAISISDLIGDVDLTKFYRYNGSLTTPMCNEVVVWTVFVEPIHVHADLLKLFPSKTHLTNVYRPDQELNGRHVYASPAVQLPAAHLWCYHGHECGHSPEHWHTLAGSHCAGHRQSPININTTNAVLDKSLKTFIFTNFDNKHAIKYIVNTGHTVKCVLKEGLVEVSGGGLEHVYSVLQFHFHWATAASDSSGSEHHLDTKGFPMEMHIVTKRKDLTLTQALENGDGLAVLGFFMEASDAKSGGGAAAAETPSHEDSSHQSNTEAWKHLTDHFTHIKTIGTQTNFTADVSIFDLLGDVDRESFYRYKGSLTTPSCNEAVVWSVFKHSVKVDHSLMQKFPTDMGYHDVYRPLQTLHNRTVYTSSSASNQPTFLVLLLTCACAFLRV